MFRRIVLGVIVLVVVLIAVGALTKKDAPQPSYDPRPAVAAVAHRAVAPTTAPVAKLPAGYDPDKKQARADFLKKLAGEQVLDEVQVQGGIGTATVRPRWFAADFDTKQTFAATLYAWCLDQDPQCLKLIIQEHMNHRQVGQFTPSAGFSAN